MMTPQCAVQQKVCCAPVVSRLSQPNPTARQWIVLANWDGGLIWSSAELLPNPDGLGIGTLCCARSQPFAHFRKALGICTRSENTPRLSGESGLCIALDDFLDEFAGDHERDAALARIGAF